MDVIGIEPIRTVGFLLEPSSQKDAQIFKAGRSGRSRTDNLKFPELAVYQLTLHSDCTAGGGRGNRILLVKNIASVFRSPAAAPIIINNLFQHQLLPTGVEPVRLAESNDAQLKAITMILDY